jgi:hypothetical protein
MHRFHFFLFSMLLLATVSVAQDTDFSQGPQYLITGSTQFLHSIATPSESLQAPLENAYVVSPDGAVSNDLVAAHPDVPSPDLQPIYWGEPKVSENVSEIKIASPELPQNLPASIFDSGVTAIAAPGSLRQDDYETTLGQIAASSKDRAVRATHVYTNADVDRFHGN